MIEYARAHPTLAPVLSPVCPAVVNLIEMRFPSLLGQVALLVSPMEAMREDLGGRRGVFVSACPCERTALESAAAKPEIIAPAVLRAAVAPLVATGHHTPHPGPLPQGEKEEKKDQNVLRVTGLAHVMRALEETENGQMGDVSVMELHACDEGCFGSPQFSEDTFVARHRSAPALEPAAPQARAVARVKPLAPRIGLRLDHDMAKAIEKLSKIQKLLRTLPGNDCGLCGSPTCAALAEDIVLGRAAADVCTHRASSKDKSHEPQ